MKNCIRPFVLFFSLCIISGIISGEKFVNRHSSLNSSVIDEMEAPEHNCEQASSLFSRPLAIVRMKCEALNPVQDTQPRA